MALDFTMSRYSRFLIPIGLALMLTLLLVAAQPVVIIGSDGYGAVQVRPDTPAQITPDSDFIVNIAISQVENLDTTNYTITFDAAVLRLDAVSAGLIGSKSVPVGTINKNNAGKYIIVQSITPALSGVSGSGYLSVLHFHAIGSAGQTSSISLSDGALINTSAGAIEATWLNASVTIAGSAGSSSANTSSTTTLPATPPAQTTAPPAQEPVEPATSAAPPLIAGQGVANVSGSIDRSEAKFIEDVSIASEDRAVILSIRKGVVGLTNDMDKEPISEISVKKVPAPQKPPGGISLIGGAYELGPEGAHFYGGIDVTLSYTEVSIPKGTGEDALYLAYWDATANSYTPLENSQVDTVRNTVTARVEHFTIFTILAPPPPPVPVFAVESITVSPSEVNPGEKVTVSALVSNQGEAAGSYEVLWKIDEVVEDSTSLVLAAGENKTVDMTISISKTGKHTVNLNGLEVEFTVKEASSPSPDSSSPAGSTPSPQETLLPPDVASSSRIPWSFIGELIGGVLVIAVVGVVFRSRLCPTDT